MAGETYYYFFSIIFVDAALLWFLNLTYLRIKKKAFFGQAYTQETAEYKKLIRLASNWNLSIAATILLILAANLVYAVNRLTHLESHPFHDSALPLAIVLVVTTFGAMVLIGHQQAKAVSILGSRKRK